MDNQSSLISFGSLMKGSWVLYRKNFKKIFYLFLPLEVTILICLVALELLPQSEVVGVAVVGIILSLIVFIVNSFSKLLTFDAPLYIERVSAHNEHPVVSLWYKALIKKIIPLAWVLFYSFAINFMFVVGVLLAVTILFVAVSLLFEGFDPYAPRAVISAITIVAFVLYFAIKHIIKFFARSVMAPYIYVFEGRKGLDAVASSFLMTSGRQFEIFWKLAGMWVVALLPFLILVVPLNIKLFFDNFDSIYFQAVILHQQPVLNISISATILQSVLTTIATLVSASFLATAHYLIWKSVQETSPVFEEDKFTKTRFMIRRLVMFGIILLLIVLVSSLVADFISVLSQ